ncbi:hypothetical protein OKW28_003725 [Paraburkholderia sp. 40]
MKRQIAIFAILHKNELDLGDRLALRFVAQELPGYYDQVEGFFRRQGHEPVLFLTQQQANGRWSSRALTCASIAAR